MSDWIMLGLCIGLFCDILINTVSNPNAITKGHFLLAEVWFYFAESTSFGCKFTLNKVKMCMEINVYITVEESTSIHVQFT